MAKKQPPDQPSVPCLRVVIGGKQGASGRADGSGCTIVGENRGGATKFYLGREYGATSRTVAPKKNKPCLGALKRRGCPVQLAFDNGQPFLGVGTAGQTPGSRIEVNSPAEAQRQAERTCAAWAANGRQFPQRPGQ